MNAKPNQIDFHRFYVLSPKSYPYPIPVYTRLKEVCVPNAIFKELRKNYKALQKLIYVAYNSNINFVIESIEKYHYVCVCFANAFQFDMLSKYISYNIIIDFSSDGLFCFLFSNYRTLMSLFYFTFWKTMSQKQPHKKAWIRLITRSTRYIIYHHELVSLDFNIIPLSGPIYSTLLQCKMNDM